MPKFQVTVMKEVWEKAEIEVDAADSQAAEAAAIEKAQADETVEWGWDETVSYDVIATKQERPEESA